MKDGWDQYDMEYFFSIFHVITELHATKHTQSIFSTRIFISNISCLTKPLRKNVEICECR